MGIHSVKYNEIARLRALYDYEILDTISEDEYDNFTRIAAGICNTQASMITFLDKDRQWFKSHHGFDVKETPRSISFCNYTIKDTQNVLVVPDMRKDERFASNPLVINAPNAVFYAGAPLVTPEGFALGSICVLDGKAHELRSDQQDALKVLAEQVMTRLELQKKIRSLKNTERKLQKANKRLMNFASIVSHDMKTPLANIMLMTRSFKKRYEKVLDKSADGYLDLINQSTTELLSFIDNILHQSKKINAEPAKQANSYDVLMTALSMVSPPEDFDVETSGEFPELYMNSTLLQQVFQNLITNAIKYNDKETGHIHIYADSDDSFHHFHFEDNGMGIEPEHLHQLFRDHVTLGKTDRFGNTGTGIGLAAIKEIIEDEGGYISVSSEKNTGSVFKVSLPVNSAA